VELVAHELRTPLTVLKTQIQLAITRQLKSKSVVADLLHKSEGSLKQLERLIQDLSECAAVRYATFTLALEQVNLGDLCQHLSI
jgi:signal transduction histidine kinase